MKVFHSVLNQKFLVFRIQKLSNFIKLLICLIVSFIVSEPAG